MNINLLPSVRNVKIVIPYLICLLPINDFGKFINSIKLFKGITIKTFKILINNLDWKKYK